MGFLDTIGMMVTIVFAVPVGMLGVNLLLDGRPLVGAGFLAIAVLMVAVEKYVTMPWDVPGKVIGRVVGGGRGGEEEDGATTETRGE